MKTIEVVNGIMDGSITIDYHGHKVEDFKQVLNRIGARDEVNEFEISENTQLWHPSYSADCCRNCGERLHLVLNGNELHLRGKVVGSKFILLDKNHTCRLVDPKPMCGEISVTGSLLFTNYFGLPDCPPGLQYDPRWSMNHKVGIINSVTYKSKYQNIAYGQMGNMSVGIYVHPNKKSVIVGNPYIADHILDEAAENMTEEDYEKYVSGIDYDSLKVIDGHKLVDTFSLSIWRWEATDMATFNKIDDESDVVKVDVEHGIWSFEHYYTTKIGDYDNIYSRFTLKE